MNDSRETAKRVVVVGRAVLGKDFEDWFAGRADIVRVESMDQAPDAVRDTASDLIIGRATDLIAPPGAGLMSGAAAVFDGVNQGVGIVDDMGRLEWANPKLLSLPHDVRERVCQCGRETFAWAQAEGRAGSPAARARRFSFTGTGNELFEITATPVIDLHSRIAQVAVVVWDATNARRLQEKIDAIDRAGRELLNLDAEQFSRLDAQERLALLEQKILRCMSEVLHFDNFEIRVLNKRTNQLDLVLAHGMPAEVLNDDIYAAAEGNGIRGYVAARGRSYICPDVSQDSRYMTGITGARSSLTVPLCLLDQVVGVANFESTRLASFNEHDRQFAEIFGRYVALALHVLELLVTERRTTAGRLGSDVMAGITAPLNDILTDVESLVEDYIGHDDLRHRLRVLSENAVKIRESIKELTSAKPGVVGVRTTAVRRDPLLSGKCVLIVDDEDVIRDTVRDVLAGHGCNVHTAQDGATAIGLIGKYPFDLVLSDIRMPCKNGYEVFAAAKAANAATPVILTTGFGYDPNHSIIRARREGLAAVLFKPFKVDQLLEEIRMALRSVKQ